MLIALFDAGLVMAAVCAALLLRSGSIDGWLPMAGTHGASLAAGIFFINAANGMYESGPHKRSRLRFLARTSLALVMALALTYGVFAYLPSGNRPPRRPAGDGPVRRFGGGAAALLRHALVRRNPAACVRGC